MAPAAGRRVGGSNKAKSPPIFSHEFVIQNHADIVSCVAMVLVVGLMFQVTSPVASLFISLKHNVTIESVDNEIPLTAYTYGPKDVFAVFFYMLLFIVVHALIQEYIFDKLNRRMHLSKVKHSKFNESGQLLVFYLASAAWGLDIIVRENYATNISSLWENYPHVHIPFLVKFYYIAQIAYWCHSYPELYFMKIKKDELWSHFQYISIYLVFIIISYVLKFMVWNALFVLVRLTTITLAVLTLWYGMSKTSTAAISFAEGNFNTQIVRINCLLAIFLLQAWLMWNFITFHLRRTRERTEAISAAAAATAGKKVSSPKSSIKKKKLKGGNDESRSDDGSGDEPVQNGSTNVRHRNAKYH